MKLIRTHGDEVAIGRHSVGLGHCLSVSLVEMGHDHNKFMIATRDQALSCKSLSVKVLLTLELVDYIFKRQDRQNILQNQMTTEGGGNIVLI